MWFTLLNHTCSHFLSHFLEVWFEVWKRVILSVNHTSNKKSHLWSHMWSLVKSHMWSNVWSHIFFFFCMGKYVHGYTNTWLHVHDCIVPLSTQAYMVYGPSNRWVHVYGSTQVPLGNSYNLTFFLHYNTWEQHRCLRPNQYVVYTRILLLLGAH